MKSNIKTVDELNDILEKNGIQCFFTYDIKNDHFIFRTYDGILYDNQYSIECKINLKTEKNKGVHIV